MTAHPTNDSPASVEEILDEYSNWVYYEGDPKRNGIDKAEATARINQLLTEARIDEWRKVMGDGDVDMDRMAEERIAALKDGGKHG